MSDQSLIRLQSYLKLKTDMLQHLRTKLERLVDEFMDGLLNEKAHLDPCDEVKVDDLELEMQLPEWFDEEKYNNGRRFYRDYSLGISISMIMGVVSVLAVPSILQILVGTRRSNSMFTAYKRYLSTLKHVDAWFNYELKPDTIAWKSLFTVRSRHLRAGTAATLAGHGKVSQRDLALTLFGFIGFTILKPDQFYIRQIRKDDWEGYNMFWRTIGYMIGLKDRYNICRKNIHETRKVCHIIQEKVFLPCLENVPEYFEHTTLALLQGLNIANSFVDPGAAIFWTKYLVEVPGYIYTEEERIAFQEKLRDHLKGKSEDTGIDTASLINKSSVEGLPKRPPRLLYLHDFDCIETTPGYRELNFRSRYRIVQVKVILSLYNTYIGRIIFNFVIQCGKYIAFYFPYRAFITYGIKDSIVYMFSEDPKDNTVPKPNAEYNKSPPLETWYQKLFAVICEIEHLELKL